MIFNISEQTRVLRQNKKNYNLVTVYVETFQKSWPAWKAKYFNHAEIIKKIVEYLISYFEEYDPEIVLTGHSGGGRFDFSFMDAFETIPDYVKRISFTEILQDRILCKIFSDEDEPMKRTSYTHNE